MSDDDTTDPDTTDPDTTDPLVRAMELCREFESTASGDVDAFLAQHEAHRELLEPLLRSPDAAEAADERTVIGEYELLHELGRGGMGVVYEAVQKKLGRTVALKLLPPYGLLSPRSLAMFRREATLAASLDHPGIVRVLDLQERDGQFALAMELVDGVPLDRVLDDLADAAPGAVASVDVARAAGVETQHASSGSYENAVVDLARQVAEALAHAHSRGVVHRDVKPSNILVTPLGAAVLTDFGLAREQGAAGMTRTGEFSGTYQYAAPEQLEGRLDAIDGRTDVYALGATLYEMLTLTRPLEAESLAEFFKVMRSEDPVPPSKVNPRVGRDLEAVVMCALEKDPRRRYAGADEFAHDLANVIAGRPVQARRLSTSARSARWMRRNPLVTSFVAVLLVATVAIAVFAWLANQSAHEAHASDQRSTKTLRRFDNLWVGAGLDEIENRAARAHPAWPDNVAELRALVRKVEVDLLPMRDDHQRVLRELREGSESEDGSERQPHRSPYPGVARIAEYEGMIRRIEVEKSLGGATKAALAGADRDIAAMRAEIVELQTLVADSNRVRIANARDADLHDRLELQLFRFRDLENVLLPDLRFRLAWAEKVESESVTKFRTRWADVAARLAEDERFKRRIEPQLGLVPLGRDRDSGLEEFAHLLSGAPPARDPESGKLALAADSAIVFVLLPGGVYKPKNTPFEVRLEPFFMAKHELSRAQWETLARGIPGLRWRDGGIADVRNLGQLTKPVNGVSWHMCDRLLLRAGLELPAAAQWEYAAYYGDRVPRTSDELAKQANLRDIAYGRARRPASWLPFNDGYVGLAPITTMRPNPAGLHHMYGNVSEWCRDAYLAQTVKPRDGDGMFELSAGKNALRLLCGGFFQGDHPLQLIDKRSPRMSARDTGLRPVRRLLQ